MANKKITYDFKVIETVVNKAAEAKTLPIARRIAEEKFEESLETFMDSLEADPVSQEIMAENAINYSSFIKGQGTRKHGANLFSFIGFESGDDPIGELLSLIRNSFRINKTSKLIKGQYKFKVTFPSEAQIKNENPFPNGVFGNRSWITGIEKGISSVIHYIRKEGFGRSEGGVQVKGEIAKTFRPKRDYFGAKYRAFIGSLKK